MATAARSSRSAPRAASAATALLLVLGLCLTAGSAVADDRDLLRQAGGDPYVFVVFDTSGSMHWTPRCSQEQLDAGICDFLCPSGDCFAPLNGDDPASKLYQAKEALWEVLQSVEGIQLGFATYNQDELVVRAKHWLYRVSPTLPDGTAQTVMTFQDGTPFPEIGSEEVFGRTWNCDNGNGFADAGCGASNAEIADTDEPLELRRTRRLPKLGIDMDERTTVYLRTDDGRRWEIHYRDVAELSPGEPNVYGNPLFAADVEIRRCTNTNDDCSSDFHARQTIYYQLVDQFVSWDAGASTGPAQQGFFSQGEASDGLADDTCDGWDGNDDTDDDRYPNRFGYSLRWPTDTSDPRNDPDDDGTNEVDFFDFGDVVPLDWNTDHERTILDRLAPNTVGDASATPDFGVASYFADLPAGGDGFLRLADETERPIVAFGATPLGNSIRDFRTWYVGCDHGACPNDVGWEDFAAAQDADWACRKKYLLVITDGDDTCPGADACSATASLRAQAGILTYVVAFGVENTSGNRLNCMAKNGGTGDPVYAANKQEIVDALSDIFADIQVASRAFSSAAVPTVQNETSDKVFFSSFTPLRDVAAWTGGIDAYRKPVPLTEDGRPDPTRVCTTGRQSACHLWNAGAELLAQAPTPDEADDGDLQLGMGTDERRVLYGQERRSDAVPSTLRLFQPPDTTADAYDLWRGLGLIGPATADGSLSASAAAAVAAEAERILGNLLKIKTEVFVDDDGETQTFVYVMGDIFHADPIVTAAPDDLRHYRSDHHGYRDFADRHFWRRRMLVTGANDGQLHFFDAGIRRLIFDPLQNVDVPKITDGTGTELFSYVPRLVLPIVSDQYDGSAVDSPRVLGRHVYSVDGTPTVADVYIDPLHDGTNATANDRGWRTVLVSGLRAGGRIMGAGVVDGFVGGYFALDITQPDVIQAAPSSSVDPRPIPTPVGAVLPSCLRVASDGDHLARTECRSPAGSPYPFPAELWTWSDQIRDPQTGAVYLFDEDDDVFPTDPALGVAPTPDGNDHHDLGATWSKPVVAQILVCTVDGGQCDPSLPNHDIEERFVAIFGGGLDPTAPDAFRRGNWLYMVDVESGETIYKRELQGAVAAGPAAVDRDQDGLVDVLYVPTTAGLVYKVDLTASSSFSDVPALEDVTVGNDRLLGDPLPPGRELTARRIEDPAWQPYPIFATGGRPVFMTPTAIGVPELDQIALAFGTGNRENLWQLDGEEGRFFVLVDEDYVRDDLRALPRVESDYLGFAADSPPQTGNLLTEPLSGSRGWALRLAPNERVITQAFSLVSVMTFTSFSPQAVVVSDDEICARTGASNIFVIDATNGNAFVDLDPDSSGTIDRFEQIGDFTTAPFVTSTATQNPDPSGIHTESDPDPEQAALQEEIRRALMKYFPDTCRFNPNYSLTVNASRSDTGLVRFATIPIAICPTEWSTR